MADRLACFKAYDIRGKVPDELNEDVAYRLGRAYAAEIRPKGPVAVGRDVRLSSQALANALIAGLNEGGIDTRFDLPGRPTSKDNTIATISMYQAFGWSCFVPPNKYRLSAYCSTETCKVIKIKKTRLEKIFKKDPAIGYTFMSYLVRVVGHRFHQLQDEVAKHRGEEIISGW